jgi:hypothetical protein
MLHIYITKKSNNSYATYNEHSKNTHKLTKYYLYIKKLDKEKVRKPHSQIICPSLSLSNCHLHPLSEISVTSKNEQKSKNFIYSKHFREYK